MKKTIANVVIVILWVPAIIVAVIIAIPLAILIMAIASIIFGVHFLLGLDLE